MNTPLKPRPRGWWYPYIFVSMFAVVIGVNAALAYFATSTFAGLETESAYDKGVAYNRTLAAAAAQRERGWTATAEVLPVTGTHGATIAVSYRDAQGQPLADLAVTAHLRRPTLAGHDTSLALAPTGNGRYAASVELPFAGQWELRLVAGRGTIDHQTSQRILIP